MDNPYKKIHVKKYLGVDPVILPFITVAYIYKCTTAVKSQHALEY